MHRVLLEMLLVLLEYHRRHFDYLWDMRMAGWRMICVSM